MTNCSYYYYFFFLIIIQILRRGKIMRRVKACTNPQVVCVSVRNSKCRNYNQITYVISHHKLQQNFYFFIFMRAPILYAHSFKSAINSIKYFASDNLATLKYKENLNCLFFLLFQALLLIFRYKYLLLQHLWRKPSVLIIPRKSLAVVEKQTIKYI